MTDNTLDAGAPLRDSAHYLHAVTELAETRPVVAQAAIYSESGIKLVAEGMRIDRRLYERLVEHTLREPVDTHLSVEGALTTASLGAEAREVFASSPLPYKLAQTLRAPEALLAPLASMPLPPSVAFKLTLMREQRPALWKHSLEMMLISLYLAHRSETSPRECTALCAAALMHDAGMLHLDPAWEDPRHKPVGAQRKHLVVHPITSMLMVRQAQVYPRSVELAILEHHERMDGSGYPRGIPGAQISALGRMLLLAEVAAAIYDKYEEMPALQLALVLRLNHRKFPAGLSAHLLPLLDEERARDSALMPIGAHAARQLEILADAFSEWDRVKASLPHPEQSTSAKNALTQPLAFIEMRLGALHKVLLESGTHPTQQNALISQLDGDAAGMAEVAFVGKEALWQLQTIVNACQRRWPAASASSPAEDHAAHRWCEWLLSRL
ncbi:MAG: HD domain-containing protein [Burkholderiaceae bacterium]|nr:HD domain-containing protein [Burkholderiaceae bacterium]MCO5104349.1 HD domain-containing protein [Burkholderiaceae bacterium]